MKNKQVDNKKCRFIHKGCALLQPIVFLLLITGAWSWTYGQDMPESTLKIKVRDETGQPLAFRMQVFNRGGVIKQIWERGEATVSISPGQRSLIIRHGFDYDAVRIDTTFLPSKLYEKTVTLKKRYDIRKLGWYCGENHMHGQHGTIDLPQTFKDAARLAEANGLNYIQVAQWWTPDFAWTSLETLRKLAADASTSLVTVNWNMESPKCYMSLDDGGETGNLHCYGHGCTLGLTDRPYDKDFWFTGPNFRIIQEIHRQNAVVMLAHPTRFWFNKGNFVSNMASEMAFDYVVGHGYDGVDIFNDGEPNFFRHERVWWNLLNMGYKVSGTAGTDGSIIDGKAGSYRTYTRINGEFSWDKIAGGIRNGACIASSGPMILYRTDDKDPGSEFPADGKSHKAELEAWSGPLPGETLVSVQVIRNGEIVRAWDLRDLQTRHWTGDFELSDRSFAWYAIRVIATCKDPGAVSAWKQPAEIYEVAVASPVYFIPEGFNRPVAAKATVSLLVTDEAGNPLPAIVSIIDAGKEISRQTIDEKGKILFNAPATAYFIIKSDGFTEVKKDLYMDSQIFDYCRDFSAFYTPGSFNKLRDMLSKMSFEVKLKKNNTE